MKEEKRVKVVKAASIKVLIKLCFVAVDFEDEMDPFFLWGLKFKLKKEAVDTFISS